MTKKILKSKLSFVLFLSVFIGNAMAQEGKPIDGIIAVIGDRIVMQSEFESQVVSLKSQGIIIDNDTKCQILEELLFQKMLVNQAAIDSVIVTDAQVDGELNRRLNYFISQIGDNDSGLFLPFFADLNEENDGFNTSNKHYLIKLFDCFPEFHPIDNNHNKFINFNEFGLAVFKNDEIHFDIRCGSVGQYGKGGHAHNDQLSFTLSVNNNPIIVDSGTYNYTANLEMRNKFRSTEMHNTLIIENMEQNPISNNKVDLFWLKDNSKAKILKAENNEFIGIHSGYGKPHRREIKIIDNVIYGKDICEIESNKIIKFHLNPIISPKFIENGILIEINGTKLALSSMTGKFSVEDSIYSKEYGIIEKNKVIILESVNFEFNWKIEILK